MGEPGLSRDVPLPTAGLLRRATCLRCKRPQKSACLCEALPQETIATETTVVILQHPFEAKEKLATMPILRLCLSDCHVFIGRRFSPTLHPRLDSLLRSSPESSAEEGIDQDAEPGQRIMVPETQHFHKGQKRLCSLDSEGRDTETEQLCPTAELHRAPPTSEPQITLLSDLSGAKNKTHDCSVFANPNDSEALRALSHENLGAAPCCVGKDGRRIQSLGHEEGVPEAEKSKHGLRSLDSVLSPTQSAHEQNSNRTGRDQSRCGSTRHLLLFPSPEAQDLESWCKARQLSRRERSCIRTKPHYRQSRREHCLSASGGSGVSGEQPASDECNWGQDGSTLGSNQPTSRSDGTNAGCGAVSTGGKSEGAFGSNACGQEDEEPAAACDAEERKERCNGIDKGFDASGNVPSTVARTPTSSTEKGSTPCAPLCSLANGGGVPKSLFPKRSNVEKDDPVPCNSGNRVVLVVLDGTWKLAREMFHANKEYLIQYCQPVTLPFCPHVKGPGPRTGGLIVKAEPNLGLVSTAEAVARALQLLEPTAEASEAILRVLRRMVWVQTSHGKEKA